MCVYINSFFDSSIDSREWDCPPEKNSISWELEGRKEGSLSIQEIWNTLVEMARGNNTKTVETRLHCARVDYY